MVLNRACVKDAMHRKDFGAVTFYWGNPGDSANQYVKGSGLSHIIAKHGVEVVDDVVETVARGSAKIVRFGTDQRAIITHKGRQAILGLFRFEKRETWLITGYRTDSKTALKFDLSKFERPIFFAGKGN